MSNIKRRAVSWRVPIILCITAFIGIFVIAEWRDDHPKKMNDIVVKSHKYPKVAHNACTGKWAIKTGETRWGSGAIDQFFVGVLRGNANITDTIVDVSLGEEITWDDSLSAANWYNGWYRRMVIADSLEKIYQKRRDSIKKCQSEYN